jgi:hypothetical protein
MFHGTSHGLKISRFYVTRRFITALRKASQLNAMQTHALFQQSASQTFCLVTRRG